MSRDSQNLIDSLVDDLEPVQPLRFSRGMAITLGAMALAVAIVIWAWTVRHDVAGGHPQGMFLLSSGLFLMLGLASAATVVLMASPRVGTPRNGWGWAAAMAGLMPLSAIVMAVTQGASAWQASEPDHGVWCLLWSIGLGLATSAALTMWLRMGAPTHPERAGLLTGIAGGCAGVFAFSFACPFDSMMHIGLWHGLAVVVCAAAGRLIVPGLVRW